MPKRKQALKDKKSSGETIRIAGKKAEGALRRFLDDRIEQPYKHRKRSWNTYNASRLNCCEGEEIEAWSDGGENFYNGL